jgi:hypothetical protein
VVEFQRLGRHVRRKRILGIGKFGEFKRHGALLMFFSVLLKRTVDLRERGGKTAEHRTEKSETVFGQSRCSKKKAQSGSANRSKKGGA